MNRLLAILPLLLLCAAPARAEIVGQTHRDNIRRYIAENGQAIYYLSSAEETHVRIEDVNFDGHDDLVMLTAQGASNAFWEFFVWDGAQYVLAGHGAAWESGLPNYELYPEQELVYAGASNGLAGLLHEKRLLRWDGTRLVEVRRAVSGHTTSHIDDGDVHVQLEDHGRVTMRVTQPTYDAEGYRDADAVLWEYESSLAELSSIELQVLQEEQSAFWRGL